MTGIYKVTNTINNKVYIGQSINIEKRWRAHRTSPYNSNSNSYNSIFYRAIRKYKINNFKFEVLEECAEDKLNEREIYWIKYYDSTNIEKGYNISLGGCSSRGVPQKINSQEAEEIRNLLLNSNITQTQLAEDYGVTSRMISAINLGENWYDSNYTYPIRPYNTKVYDNENPVKEKKYCPRCGKIIGNKSKFCIACHNYENRVVKDRPTREELKKMVRQSSFVSIGRKYGVSDNAIRGWCKTYNLPSRASDIKKYSDEEWSSI